MSSLHTNSLTTSLTTSPTTYFGALAERHYSQEKTIKLMEPNDQELTQFCCKLQEIILKIRKSNPLYYGDLFSPIFLERIPTPSPSTDRLSSFGAELLLSVYKNGYGCYEMQVFMILSF